MNGREHMSFGLVTGVAAGIVLSTNGVVDETATLGFVALSLLGSLVPDADHEHSKINSMFPPAKLIHYIFRERGLFHDPAFWGIIAGIMAYFSVDIMWFGIILGIAGHLFLDSFTVWGIPFLCIFKKRWSDGKLHDRFIIHLFPKGMRCKSNGKAAIAVTWALNIIVVAGLCLFFR